MKPQCETTVECLEQLARVMREFGFTSAFEAIGSGFVKYKFVLDPRLMPKFAEPELWSFAIAKLEDKPVFIGDTTFSTVSGRKYTAVMSSDKRYWWLNDICEFQHQIADTSNLSWTPSKQTVSIKVGDNEPVEVEKVFKCYITDQINNFSTVYRHDTHEAAEQFRKAMKPLVKE